MRYHINACRAVRRVAVIGANDEVAEEAQEETASPADRSVRRHGSEAKCADLQQEEPAKEAEAAWLATVVV